MKVIFPGMWISGFLLATLTMFVSPSTFKDSGGGVADPSLKWIFLLATVLGSAFIYWGCIRLKRVDLDEQAIVVSNYVKTIRIPLQQIEDVTENRWVNIHPVTIHFRNETEFGSSIVFMPKVRWFGFWSSHPVVEELRTAADRASTRQPHVPRTDS